MRPRQNCTVYGKKFTSRGDFMKENLFLDDNGEEILFRGPNGYQSGPPRIGRPRINGKHLYCRIFIRRKRKVYKLKSGKFGFDDEGKFQIYIPYNPEVDSPTKDIILWIK
jgi:hypothetical protein